MAKLFGYFWNSNKAWANQLTISMDVVPRIGNSVHLLRFARYLEEELLAPGALEREERPEVHLTLRNLLSAQAYRFNGQHSLFENVDVVTVSNGCSLDTPFKENKLVKFLNRNFMLDISSIGWNSSTTNMQVDLISRTLEVYDHVYMLLNKTPIGKPVDLDIHKKYLAKYQEVYTLLSNSLGDKISRDTCVDDSEKFIKTGFGCSSNVSKFQVWPDGTVSGCPYAIRGHGKVAVVAEDILDNIRQARKVQDFSECYIHRAM